MYTDSNGARRERITASPRWDGTRFRNSSAIPRGDPSVAMPSLSEFICGGGRRVPQAPLPAVNPIDSWTPARQQRPARDVARTLDGVARDRRLAGADRSGLGRTRIALGFAGPKRFQPVPVAVRALPPLDAVVISHDHYDHLDHSTIAALRKSSVPFFTSLGVGAHLEALGIRPERIMELDWWESQRVPGGLSLTAAPSQHFSGRGLERRQHDALVLVRASRPNTHRVFFSGDTGLTTEYSEIRATARALRPRHARGRRVASRLGRHPPRSGKRAAAHALARWRAASAGALGHVQSRTPRLGRARRDTRCSSRPSTVRSWSCRASASPSSLRMNWR